MSFNPLTEEEKKVIEQKGTEKPFSGKYDEFFEEGLYVCRKCGAPLYSSKDKFNSGCGWPSFDDEIKDAVKKTTDADGMRTEITCANCEAHLGHVFTGEHMTEKDTRHCVNSVSMHFVPNDFKEGEENIAVLAGGCFWCIEATFQQIQGVISVMPGYTGGHKPHPTYEEVSSGETGHAEALKITFDNSKITYRDLLEIFFYVHDPTTLNRQGNDVGTQYRSAIFYKTVKQKEEAEKIIKEFNDNNDFGKPLVTEVKPLMYFYDAEDYHKNYFKNNPNQPYCQIVIAPKIEKLKKKFYEKLKK